MIPTYRPKESYLRQTIESVLAQDFIPSQMQIEVVDDSSPDVDVAAMVKSIAGQRVAFSRTPKNLGLAGCWNTCIERARGQWIHLLHQDDFVLPGFYRTLARAAELHPDVSLLATPSFWVDEKGVVTGVSSKRLHRLEKDNHAVDDFFYGTPVECPGVAVKRSFYETHGGFMPDFVYVLDVEMWTRVISLAGGLVTPEALACYRTTSGNETGRLARLAENLQDLKKLNQLFAGRHPTFDCKKADDRVLKTALGQVEHFLKIGDKDAARASLAYWKANVPLSLRLRRQVGELVRKTFGRPA